MTIEEAKEKECRNFPRMAQSWGPVGGTTHIQYIPSKTSGYCGLSGKKGSE